MQEISLPIQTLFSDLEQRTLDADFTESFEKPGSFKKMKRGNKYYWYWQFREGKKVVQKYVGPFTDKDITARVEHFNDLKDDFRERSEIVRALASSGLPKTDSLTGRIIDSLTRAGFFRLRGVLIGTTAYQCYSGILGFKLALSSLRTQDADQALDFAIANKIDDTMPPTLSILKEVDETFRKVPHQKNKTAVVAFMNKARYRVEFLTSNRGSNDYQDKPAPMPALGGTSTQPLRFLDFLIKDPVRSVLLFEGGIPVTIPAPERYLVHKLIVADRRHETSRSKANKDIEQAATLIKIMSEKNALAVFEAWEEAWERGPSWREALENGLDRLESKIRDELQGAVVKGCKKRKLDYTNYWPDLS